MVAHKYINVLLFCYYNQFKDVCIILENLQAANNLYCYTFLYFYTGPVHVMYFLIPDDNPNVNKYAVL